MNNLELIIQSALAKTGVQRVELQVQFVDPNNVFRFERFDFYNSDFRQYVIAELEKEFIMLKRSDIETLSKIQIPNKLK